MQLHKAREEGKRHRVVCNVHVGCDQWSSIKTSLIVRGMTLSPLLWNIIYIGVSFRPLPKRGIVVGSADDITAVAVTRYMQSARSAVGLNMSKAKGAWNTSKLELEPGP